ncbi:hypothetical protein [Flavobacterium sp. H122]|uniref:hypothetical protein n=1 Tax=Flavobacterium sp. H122 TaxID=2529860 RepID=UPI0010AA848B|nr:hypothetical protein [Flavobacterium sp. H122]
MKVFCYSLLLFTSIAFSQIKKQQHKDFRSPKEIEQEKVITEMKKHFKNDYLFTQNNFYKVDANLTVNNTPFYLFNGISKLKEISPIECESKYQINKEIIEAYIKSENAVFKKERAPREMIPFYLVAVFSKLENIYENYHFFSAKDFNYNLTDTNPGDDFYQLTFQSKNPKLPVRGKIILDKKTYSPKSLTYNITEDYIFEMSSENFNYKKSTRYLAKVIKESVKIEFQNSGNQFMVAKYESEYNFKNSQNNSQEISNGDEGHSKIAFELYPNEPKICNENFNLNTLE